MLQISLSLIQNATSSQRSQLLHEYIKLNNLSYAFIYKKLFDELPHQWNISGAIEKFYNKSVKGISQSSKTIIALESTNEWRYFYAVRSIIGSDKELDWYPENLGSFFITWLLEMSKDPRVKVEDRILFSEHLDKAFIIPDMNISILNFVHLHTKNDFQQLLDFDIAKMKKSHYDVAKYLVNFPSSFSKCFSEEKSYFHQITLEKNSDDEHKEPYMLKSPCVEKRHVNVCVEYCQLRNKSKYYFSEKEFISLMKYALPQSKVTNEQDETEHKMSAKIVGKESLKRKPKFAPAPLVILCKFHKYQGWEGEEIGMDLKFCDSFVQVPTDVGVCLTGAINRADIIKSDESVNYGDFGTSKKIRGGTIFSKATFFLNTEYGRSSPVPSTIEMHIHQRTELAQILHELDQDHSRRSFTLKSGHEYTFEVSIEGRMITENFRELPIKQRKCKLPNEVDETSWFNYYSKRHCKYTCRVKLAYAACLCIPWDIYHIGNYPECDVFGRTCFKNTMENITQSNDLCDDCYDDCQYLKYRYKLTNIATDTIQHKYGGKNDKLHVKFHHSYVCKGMKALCHYLEDKNNTLYDIYSPERHYYDLRKRFEGMIVVNIVFPTSEADLTVMDVRYTLIDKITSLGGSFGLYTQFTGCSVIAVIHLVILTIKQMFTFFKDLKLKFCRRN